VTTRDFPSRHEIEALQLRKLQQLIDALLPSNQFYSQKFSGQKPVFSTLTQFSQVVPETSRPEIVHDQLAHPPYGSNLTHPLESYARCHQTSGTSTAPLRWLDTRESWASVVSKWHIIFDAAGITPADRFLFAFSFGPFLGFWSALEAVHELGNFCFPGGSMTSEARLRALLDHKITVLCCTPTYARHLGEVARDGGVSLEQSKVRLIVVAGESGGSIPATRACIEALWPGALVFDHHGMTEVGPVSHQCAKEPGVLHIIESGYFAEVLDPQTGSAAESGETGELVLTTLDRAAAPLLRYRTADLVRARPRSRCACGLSDLALEGGILGRSDDMVVIRGVNVYPSLIEEIVRACPEILEYRVLLDETGALAELGLEVELAANCGNAHAVQKQLEHSLRSALNLRVPVETVARGTLPRFEMKAHRWVKVGHK
jgi:phenylacetate-CoA ligase